MTWSAWLICALVLGGVVYLSLAAFVWAHRESVGSRPLIIMLLAVKFWSLCYALELSSRSVHVAQWWSALKYVGVVALPPALWSFVMAYTGRGRLSPRAFRLLLIHPVLLLGLLAVPATHDFVQRYPAHPAHLLGAPVPVAGFLFWPHAVYMYVLMLSADFVLMARLARIAPEYRRQGAVLIAASVVPFVGNVAFNAGWLAPGMIDPTPFLFGITAVVLVWGFFRFKLLDLAPVARGVVIEQMADGVLVLDVYGRVADVNAAGAVIVGQPRSTMVGRSAVEIIPGLAPVLQLSAGPSQIGPLEREVVLERQGVLVDRDGVVQGEQPAGVRHVAVSLTAVTDPMGHQIARLVVLRDITELKRTERQIRDLLAEQTKLSETLRQSLRPASLPQLPGLRLAARSVPSARGGGVGGDFYDVHPAGEGVSAFVLGDVSGKGVHAAVVTSMARYTVRTLSAQGWSPRQVLEQLNRALQAPDDLERFCTVVYGQIRSNGPASTESLDDEAVSGVRLVLTLGGHPPPLLRRGEGSVRPVGSPGTALGLLPEIDVHEVTVDLASGDVLLAYTDGVTEARDGDELFGEERLAGVLAAVGEHPAAQLADAVADAVLEAVKAFSPERDDVALLVLAVT